MRSTEKHAEARARAVEKVKGCNWPAGGRVSLCFAQHSELLGEAIVRAISENA